MYRTNFLIFIAMIKIKRNEKYDFFERFCRSVVYITLYNIGISMFLSILGFYSMYMVCIIDFLIGVILLFSIFQERKYIKLAFADVKSIVNHKYIIVILFCCVILYAAFPINYMLGGRGPGLYYLNGIHIAQTGAYQYEEDLYLTENNEELEGVVTPGYMHTSYAHWVFHRKKRLIL